LPARSSAGCVDCARPRRPWILVDQTWALAARASYGVFVVSAARWLAPTWRRWLPIRDVNGRAPGMYLPLHPGLTLVVAGKSCGRLELNRPSRRAWRSCRSRRVLTLSTQQCLVLAEALVDGYAAKSPRKMRPLFIWRSPQLSGGAIADARPGGRSKRRPRLDAPDYRLLVRLGERAQLRRARKTGRRMNIALPSRLNPGACGSLRRPVGRSRENSES